MPQLLPAIRPSLAQGWSAFAAEVLPAGKFLCQYAGELIPAAEANKRLRDYERSGIGHALLVRLMSSLDHVSCCDSLAPKQQVVREVLPSGRAVLRLNIDATHVGNAAHFFNHRWDMMRALAHRVLPMHPHQEPAAAAMAAACA